MPGAYLPRLVSMKYSTNAEITGGMAMGSSTRPISTFARRERRYQMPRLKLTASAVAITQVAVATIRLWLMLDSHSGLLSSAS
ncbi:hypothetical protein D9M72_631910 [compost metagenome]